MHSDFSPGCFRMSCDICGRVRLFPDEIAQCDDKLWRCFEACMEETTRTIDDRIRASHFKREAPDPTFGTVPQFDRTTFRSDSIDRQKELIEDWTPTTILYDDFSTLPGAVGSSWSLALTGTASVSALSGGGCRFDPGTGTCKASVTSMAAATPTTGNFYMRMAFSSPDTSPPVAASAPVRDFWIGVRDSGTSAMITAGAINTISRQTYAAEHLGNTFNFARSKSALTTDACILEMWWKGESIIYYRVNSGRGGPVIRFTYNDSHSYKPFIGHSANAGYRLDVTECVFMV